MKKIYLVLFMAMTIGLFGCRFGKSNVVSGTILDATMNTLTILDSKTSDTLSFSTMDAEKEVEDGILIGDFATVTYEKGEQKDFGTATKIQVKAMPQLRIIGSWLQPIPGMEAQMQGIKIMEEGKAESINMYTLLYNSWSLAGPDQDGKYTLSLSGTSIGNGVSSDFTEEYSIDCFTGNHLNLSSGETTQSYSRLVE